MNKILRFSSLTHVNEIGKASMVNVGNKSKSSRTAKATATVLLGKSAFDLVKSNLIGKGDVLGVAKIAGIQAAKNTASVIPLCHPLMLNYVSVDLKLEEESFKVKITSVVECDGKTGVEMEALHAASIAALTVYDMTKAVDKSIVISNIKLVAKTGGKSGDYIAD